MISSAIFLLVLGIAAANPHNWGMPHGQYYPHGHGYSRGQNYRHGHGHHYPHDYPEGQNFPQGQNYPEGQNFPQGQNYPEEQNYPEGQNFPRGQNYPEGQNYPQGQYYPQSDVNSQQPQQYIERQPLDPYTDKPRVKLVQGSMDDLKNMDTQWICTNQKSGDTMIIGSMDGTGNILVPKTQQPQQPQQPQPPQFPQPPQRPQQPQQPQPRPLPMPQNPEQSVTTSEQPKPTGPTRNPGFVEVLPAEFTEPKKDPFNSPYTTTRDPLEDFDWAAYIKTANCSAPTPTTEFDGTGIIQPRVNI